MPKLIRNGEVQEDNWTLLKEATDPGVLQAVPGRRFIAPLKFWKLHRDELLEYQDEVALWLDSDEVVADIAGDLDRISVIGLNFPVFSDGRNYTNARELREQHDFKGEIRAIGDVLRDQIYYMSQCGFNAFALRHDQDPEACLQAFNDFHTGYQATVLEPRPLFRRR